MINEKTASNKKEQEITDIPEINHNYDFSNNKKIRLEQFALEIRNGNHQLHPMVIGLKTIRDIYDEYDMGISENDPSLHILEQELGSK